ncbi:hypothetical protein [Streptomyces sp. CA2R101]|uniref:hypothetical protein n=1 Tax=Streptomyces sp. CA2R101 TaxID=3120152 RepID=UPI00300AF831
MNDSIFQNSSLKTIHEILRIDPDMLSAVVPETAQPDATLFDVLGEPLIGIIRKDAEAREAFLRACCFEAPFGESWIHQTGVEGPYLSLELASAALDPEQYRATMAGIALSLNNAIPYDYRALAAERLLQVGPGAFLEEFRRVANTTEPLPLRQLDVKIGLRTDGIDHLFDIPETLAERLDLLKAASVAKTLESRAVLARRIVQRAAPQGHTQKFSKAQATGNEGLRSAAAEELIAQDAATDLIDPSDYLVVWDQELATPSMAETALTLAELLRIVLLCPEFKLPDTTVRPILVDFYRAVLKVSGRAIIGLSGGVFYVEHGADAHPSYFYMGRDAVIGKGCTIDCVGGVVLQRGSFLGGGFMPILIHTHKHIRKAGELGVAERKKILPCVFAARTGARLPMDAIGIFETADYIGQEASPYTGISAIPFDS